MALRRVLATRTVQRLVAAGPSAAAARPLVIFRSLPSSLSDRSSGPSALAAYHATALRLQQEQRDASLPDQVESAPDGADPLSEHEDAGALMEDETLREEQADQDPSIPGQSAAVDGHTQLGDAQLKNADAPRPPQRNIPEERERTVFVGSLPFRAEPAAIAAEFAKAGKVEDVQILRTFDGLSKGAAFVRFQERSSVQAALAMDTKEFQGRIIFVERLKARPDGQAGPRPADRPPQGPNQTVFIGNLPATMDPAALEGLLTKYGTISRLAVRPGAPFGHADFVDIESARRLVEGEPEGLLFDGRMLRFDYAGPKRTQSPRFGGGHGGSSSFSSGRFDGSSRYSSRERNY